VPNFYVRSNLTRDRSASGSPEEYCKEERQKGSEPSIDTHDDDVMPRPLRIEYPEAIHVLGRGDRREVIFRA